ncbi:MAG: PadR family transcriptional regulator [bacterium]|nr:PadR family transcriptional regulator [bacterium]
MNDVTDPADVLRKRISSWESQARKGVLELVILLHLSRKEMYGYELIRTIKQGAELNLSEGTIYPLLNRLQKVGLIDSRWAEMDSGKPRKYYHLTQLGTDYLPALKEAWWEFSQSIGEMLEER